jgi:hypothetical protein
VLTTHIELVDLLRCPRTHEESWLVATADRMVGRHIVEGQLGCPVCEASYRVDGGDVLFSPRTSVATSTSDEVADVLRTAAMLNLADPGGVVLLVGGWGAYADAVSTVVDAHILVLDPTTAQVRASRVYAGGAVPLAAASVRAVATDQPEAVVRVVKPGGRIVAPVTAPVPPGVKELARDARYWVGETTGAPTRLILGASARPRTRP